MCLRLVATKHRDEALGPRLAIIEREVERWSVLAILLQSDSVCVELVELGVESVVRILWQLIHDIPHDALPAKVQCEIITSGCSENEAMVCHGDPAPELPSVYHIRHFA